MMLLLLFLLLLLTALHCRFLAKFTKPQDVVGIMVAANSGRPGGSVGDR